MNDYTSIITMLLRAKKHYESEYTNLQGTDYLTITVTDDEFEQMIIFYFNTDGSFETICSESL